MNESAEQYLRSDLRGKCRNLARTLEKVLTDDCAAGAKPPLTSAHYAMATALARAVHVIETDGSPADEMCLMVLQSFTAAAMVDPLHGDDRDTVDSIQIAKTQYLTLIRRQSIRVRAAALEAGQKLIADELPVIGLTERGADNASNTPFKLST